MVLSDLVEKWFWEMLRMERIVHLPCAGITLFRFYGYDLSLAVSPAISTPRNLGGKNRE
jgi:hypothetical protein